MEQRQENIENTESGPEKAGNLDNITDLVSVNIPRLDNKKNMDRYREFKVRGWRAFSR